MRTLLRHANPASGLLSRWVTIALIALISHVTPARASGIPSAIIGPHEYDLPLRFSPINEFVEYGYWNNNNHLFDASGAQTAGPGTNTYVGLSKFAHLFTVASMPDLGWEVEVLVPEIRIEGSEFAASGLGDPIAGAVVWWKPSATSTLGFDSFIQAPFGNGAVSSNYWANISSFIFDYNLHRFNFDGDVGFIWPGIRHQTGVPDARPGHTWFTNLRFAYRATRVLEPFLALDYQHTAATEDSSGRDIADSSNQEIGVGVGAMWYLAANSSFTASYNRGISGRNTVRTNAIYVRYIYSW